MKINKFLSYATFITLTIVVIELLLRVFGWGDPPIAILDDNIEYYVAPSSSFNRYGNQIEINRYGMRSRDFDRENLPKLHVSLLGDSVVYGNHFLDQSETIGFQLERMLRTTEEDALVSVIAASSWGPQNIDAFFNKKGPFSGRVAILVQSAHDRYDVIHSSSSIVPYRTKPSMTAISDFTLRLWEWARDKWFHQESSQQKLTRKEASATTKKALIELLRTLKAHYDVVILFYHTTKSDLSKPNQDSSDDYFRNMAKATDIYYINSREFYAIDNRLNDLYRDHIHLSRQGANYVAEFLYEWLLNHNHLNQLTKPSNGSVKGACR